MSDLNPPTEAEDQLDSARLYAGELVELLERRRGPLDYGRLVQVVGLVRRIAAHLGCAEEWASEDAPLAHEPDDLPF